MRPIALTDLSPTLQRQVADQLRRKDQQQANNILKAFKPLVKVAKKVLAETKPVSFTIEHLTFMRLLDVNFIHRPESEYRFCPSRKFRADYAFIHDGHKVLLELEGGVFTKQAHGSVTGVLRDIEKYSLAAAMGFLVLRILPSKLNTSETIKLIKDALRFKVVEG